MTRLIVVSERDNVATALEPLEPGQLLTVGPRSIVVIEPVPRGHKIALRPLAAGDPVVKFGSPIGVASAEIPEGAHVHVHNVSSTRGRGDLSTMGEAG